MNHLPTGFPFSGDGATRFHADIWGTHGVSCGESVREGVQVNRFLFSERGSIASEISSGLVMVAILVAAGLWVIAQLEGVSFGVLIDQLRHGTHH